MPTLATERFERTHTDIVFPDQHVNYSSSHSHTVMAEMYASQAMVALKLKV